MKIRKLISQTMNNRETFCVILTIIVFACMTGFCRAEKIVGPLLTTNWGQRQEYAAYAPDHQRVGCWTTAFGQILHHHLLFPCAGKVRYKCNKKGYRIKEVIDGNMFNRKEKLESMDDIARYMYHIALIIQKDFGTGSYKLKHKKRAKMVEKYFECKTEYFKRLKMKVLLPLLQDEIDKGRPVLIHLRDRKKKSFHAAVVDGYKTTQGSIHYHINMGHMGKDNGWFSLDSPIGKYNDTTYHRLITVIPDQTEKIIPTVKPYISNKQPLKD